jgi:hypothetical protein
MEERVLYLNEGVCLLLFRKLIFDDLIDKPLNINDVNKRINHINRLNSHHLGALV